MSQSEPELHPLTYLLHMSHRPATFCMVALESESRSPLDQTWHRAGFFVLVEWCPVQRACLYYRRNPHDPLAANRVLFEHTAGLANESRSSLVEIRPPHGIDRAYRSAFQTTCPPSLCAPGL